MDISEEIVNYNSVDIIRGYENGWDILKKIRYPFEFCKYCSKDVIWFDWCISGKK